MPGDQCFGERCIESLSLTSIIADKSDTAKIRNSERFRKTFSNFAGRLRTMVGLIAPKTLVTVIERQGLVNMEPAYMNVITNIPCVEVEDYVDFDDRIRRPHLAYIDNPMAVTTFWIQVCHR